MKKMIKTISLALILAFMFNTICFAATGPVSPGSYAPDTFTATTGKNVAWVPTDGKGNAIMIRPEKNGTIYSRVMYLTKLEAIAVNEGYRDSEFKSQFKTVMDYTTRTGSYAGGYIAGKKLVDTAKSLKCFKVAEKLSGVGGAVAIGFFVDGVINLVKNVDYNLLKAEINKTQENYWVQIKVGIAASPYTVVTVPVKEYKAWNSNKLYGMSGYHGQWISAYAQPVKPPSWLN